jgi:hypothetical protein
MTRVLPLDEGNPFTKASSEVFFRSRHERRMDLSDAAGLIVLAGRLLFAIFFAWIAGMGISGRAR